MRGVMILILLILVVGVAWAAGLFSVSTSGQLKAPVVSVQGGEVPKLDVETAKVNVGAKEKTVQVPDVHVEQKTTTVKVPTFSVDKPAEAAK